MFLLSKTERVGYNLNMLLTQRDFLVLAVFIGIGLVTHFSVLGWPDQVIFDEVHFGKFITAYCCTGERFFDIHPPHAKLLIAGTSWLGGYRGGFAFDHIGQVYEGVPIAAMRFVPAAAGMILPLVIFVVIRQLGASFGVALVGAAAVLLDNALTIQTRVIALDGVLLVATFGSLSAYLAGERAHGWHQAGYFLLAGALAGLAAGTKFTGLAALGLLGAIVVVRMLQRIDKQTVMAGITNGLLIVASALIVYLAGWVLHFALLPLPGSGDAFHVPHSLLPPQRPNPSSFLRETVALHKVMFTANYNLTATHPNASSWWSWPLMQMPVFYWTDTAGLRHIYFVGNPVVWWGVTLLFVVAVLVWIIQLGQRRREAASGIIWISVVGFCIAMLPLVRVPRALFLYHYLTPLLFSLLAGLVWLDRELARVRLTLAGQRRLIVGVLAVLLAGFLFMSPLTYGLKLGETTLEKDARLQTILFWLPGP